VSVDSATTVQAQTETYDEASDVIEIRWHGRAGQGAKTGALLVGEAASGAGRYIQAFPEYGPERMGAPVVAYNRISREPITLHCGIENPRYVVILDTTLAGQIDMTAGVPDGGAMIVNASWSPAEAREKLGITNPSVRVYTIDATAISLENIGRPIPNTPMLGALNRVAGLLDIDSLLASVRKKLEQRFRNRPEIVEGNVEAVRRAYEEVQGE
jgi:pyruvate ferredoxin oxidoreductase gamma subunit